MDELGKAARATLIMSICCIEKVAVKIEFSKMLARRRQ